MDPVLLSKLKIECQKALADNTRFHDIGHALEVLHNTQKILQFETGDEDTLFAAALFHDVSNQSGQEEGIDSAHITQNILSKISEFPQQKIIDVCRIIRSISGQVTTRDELIINEADRMAVFSKLSLVRGFMLYAQRGLQPRQATEDFLTLIEKKYQHFKIPQARELIEDDYLYLKNFLTEVLKSYSQSAT